MSICASCGARVETKIAKTRRLYAGRRVTTARIKADLGWTTDTISWVMRELVFSGWAEKLEKRGTWEIYPDSQSANR